MRLTADEWGMLEAFEARRYYDRPGITTEEVNGAVKGLVCKRLITQAAANARMSWKVTEAGQHVLDGSTDVDVGPGPIGPGPADLASKAIEIRNADGGVCITVRKDSVLAVSRFNTSTGDEEIEFGCILELPGREIRLYGVEPEPVIKQLGWAVE